MAKTPVHAEPGHNSKAEEVEALALFHINRRAYHEALAAKKAADAKLKNVGKTLKADLGEHGLQKIKDYDLAQTPEGQEKLKAEIDARTQAMRFAGMAVNTQVDMFADLAPLAERAYAAGMEAGMRGDTLSNPYNEASAEGQEYARGWHGGQEAIFAITKKRADADADELIKGEGADPDFPDPDNQNGEHAEAAE